MHTPYENLLASLARAQVKFILVGGVAVALNGFVRTTEDVDILVEPSAENIQRLLDNLASFGGGHARELSLADFDETEGAIRVAEDFPLDIFTVMRGHKYSDLVDRVCETSVGGIAIRFLNAAALILLKQDSSREKDQIDIAALRQLAGEDS